MAERWLVIDDSATIQRVIKLAFQDYDVAITEAESMPEATRELSKAVPTLVIADAALAGVQSVQDFVTLQQLVPQAVFVILEGSYDHIDESQFRSVGFKFFLKKPFDGAQLIGITRQALGRAINKRNQEGSSSLGNSLLSSFQTPAPAAATPTSLLLESQPPGVGEQPEPVVDAGSSSPFRRSLDEPTQLSGLSTFDLGFDEGTRSDISNEGSKTRLAPVNFSLEDEPLEGKQDVVQEPLRESVREPSWDPNREPVREPRSESVRESSWDPNREPVHEPFRESVRESSWNANREPVRESIREPVRESIREPIPNASLSGMLEPLLQQEMEKLVRAAVEDYCRQHFAELARELILRELDRLTQERARLLVDK